MNLRRIRRRMSAGERRRRIEDRLGSVGLGILLARPFGLTERGHWLDRFFLRNSARLDRVVKAKR